MERTEKPNTLPRYARATAGHNRRLSSLAIITIAWLISAAAASTAHAQRQRPTFPISPSAAACS